MQASKLQLIQSLAGTVCQRKQQICPPEILTCMMALPVPETFDLAYTPPTKESVVAAREEPDHNPDVNDIICDSEETSVVNGSRPALSRYESTTQQVEYQTDQDRSIVTQHSRMSLRDP